MAYSRGKGRYRSRPAKKRASGYSRRSSYSGRRPRRATRSAPKSQTVRIVIENPQPTDPMQALMQSGMKPSKPKKSTF